MKEFCNPTASRKCCYKSIQSKTWCTFTCFYGWEKLGKEKKPLKKVLFCKNFEFKNEDIRRKKEMFDTYKEVLVDDITSNNISENYKYSLTTFCHD